MINVLLVSIDLVNELLIVHLLIEVCLSLLDGVHPSEVIWAPHLVGIQLIRAAELVSIFSAIYASHQGVLRLEAQLLVPTVLGRVMISQESKPGILVHH